MSKLDKADAIAVLQAVDAKPDQDFHTLSGGQVECLLSWARHFGYRQPRNANGSKARYFFAYLQRLTDRNA